MSGNPCFRQNMETLFLSSDGRREFFLIYTLFTAAFLVSLPGKPYYFYLVQGVIPASFSACSAAVLWILLFFSIRRGRETADPDSFFGISNWLYEKKLSSLAVWYGISASHLIHLLVQNLMAFPYILITGKLSGLPVSRVLAASVCIAVVVFVFRLTAMFFSLLSGGITFTGTFFTGVILLAVFLGTLGPLRALNPVILLMSGARGLSGGLQLFLAVYGAFCLILLWVIGMTIRRRKGE